MKAVVLNDINDLVLTKLPTPSPGPGEVLIQVLACGICGTDRHIYKGEYPSKKPVVLGHEFGGRITSLGSEVSEFKIGDLVSVDPNIVCGLCEDCLAKRTAFCPKLTALGVNTHGGLAEYALVPRTQIYKVPENLNPNYLAFIEPLACTIRGFDLGNLQGGEKVAILGGGVIGLLAVQLAKLAKAKEIILITRQSARRETALKIGATRAFDPNQEDVIKVVKGMDVSFECAGATATFKQAQQITRRGGSIIVLGLTAQGVEVPISPFDLVINEHKIQGSYLNPHTQQRAAELVASGSLQLEPLISKVVPLDQVPNLLAADPGQGDIKYIVSSQTGAKLNQA
ncbi:MAG: zinc-dependent alcohol dehydrogenase family protein [Candidatus Nanopelagicales bacterium]